MKNLMGLIAASILFLGCAHHQDVRPGAEGVHRVVIQTDNEDEGERGAISQANHYCKGLGKSAAFIDENKKYTGDMSEQKYKDGKRLSNVAKVAGGATYVMGGRRESNLGGIVGLGGAVADAALGKAYTVEMKFKCM
ncbi:MAG: hypothetical protein SGJ18_15645 [Pseudomonadota bacterium]|nr:hypothetical protein [Pseudomonadota bacterium]